MIRNLITRVSGETILLQKLICGLVVALQIGATLLVAREHPNAWSAESEGALPAAISYSVYGRPLGTIDSNVRDDFARILRDGRYTAAAMSEAVRETSRGDIPRGDPISTTLDGIGAGQLLFMSLSMKLLGPRLSSTLYVFLIMMAGSMFIFVLRFRDDRLFAVPVLCVALSLIFLTPVALDQAIANQVPVGGNRFFGLLAALPAIHLCFEIAEPGYERSSARAVLAFAAIQASILAIAIFVRSSAAYLLAPILLFALLRFRGTRANGAMRWKLHCKLAVMVVATAISMAVMLGSMSNYVRTGRAFGNVWHRAFVSLALHPDWPFGNLRDVYDCTNEIPEGLNRRYEDRNGHCVWLVHEAKQGRSIAGGSPVTYGAEYERAMRQALFSIIWSYPRQAFELYFYYKPRRLFETLARALDFDVSRSPPALLVMLLSQIVLAAGFVVSETLCGRRAVGSRSAIFFLLFVLSLAPQFVAWSSLWTSVDVIVYMYASVVVVAAFAIQAAGFVLLRAGAGRRQPGLPKA